MDTKRLNNGFRYVKEILLQHLNLIMYKEHQTLTHNHNMNVYAGTTDAFTLVANNLELANSLLKFDNTMGS